jgi:hypothetical protein
MEEGPVGGRGEKGGGIVKIGKTVGLGIILLMTVPPAIRALDAGPRRNRQRRIRQRMLQQAVKAPMAKDSQSYRTI